MIDPILIMATPRSGSSMTAGLFAAHGVWTGKVRPGSGRNPKGFFESLVVRDHITKHFGKLVRHGEVCDRVPGWRALIEPLLEAEGYPGGPWLWKGSAIYWPAWFEWDKPTYVVVRRDVEATVESLKRKPYALHSTNDDYLRRIVLKHHEQLDILVNDYGAFEIDTQATALGDFSSLERAITGCGLKFKPEIAAAFVDADLWHHRAEPESRGLPDAVSSNQRAD